MVQTPYPGLAVVVICINQLTFCHKHIPLTKEHTNRSIVIAAISGSENTKHAVCLPIRDGDLTQSPFSTWRICSRDTKREQEFDNVIG